MFIIAAILIGCDVDKQNNKTEFHNNSTPAITSLPTNSNRDINTGTISEQNRNITSDINSTEMHTYNQIDLTTQNNSVTVHNAREFLDALKSDVHIRLEPGNYDLNKYLEGDNPYQSLYIKEGKLYGLKNVLIEGLGDQPLDFITYNSFSPVLSISNCEYLSLVNLNFGHDPAIGSGNCTGDVVDIQDSKNINIEKCVLFGCGMVGMNISNVQTMEFNDSVIKECSDNIAYIIKCKDISFNRSKFLNNGSGVRTGTCENIKFTDCDFVGTNNIPSFEDYDQYCYLTDEGTIQGDFSGYSTVFIDHFIDSISNVSLNNVWLSNNSFFQECKNICSRLKNSYGNNFTKLGLTQPLPDDSNRKLTLTLDIAFPKDFANSTLDDINRITEQLQVIKKDIQTIKIQSVILNFYNNESNMVQLTADSKELENFLSDGTGNGIENYAEIKILSQKINPAAFLKKSVKYINGSDAITRLNNLIDIKKEVDDEAYMNGGYFQFFTYKGAVYKDGRLTHKIYLEQELPLLGDYLHYSIFAEFEVDASIGDIVATDEMSGNKKVVRVPDEIKKFIIDTSKISFDFKKGENEIGEVDNKKIYNIIGNCDTYEKVGSLLGNFFTEKAFNAELLKRNLVITNNQIGIVDSYSWSPESVDEKNSLFLLLEDQPDRKIVKVQLFSANGGVSCAIYTLEKKGDIWIITDESIHGLPSY